MNKKNSINISYFALLFVLIAVFCSCGRAEKPAEAVLPWDSGHKYNFFLEDGADFQPILFEGDLYSTDEGGYLYVYDAETRECTKLCDTFFQCSFAGPAKGSEPEEYLLDEAGNIVKWMPKEVKTLYESSGSIHDINVLNGKWYFMDGSLLMTMDPETDAVSMLCDNLSELPNAGEFRMYARNEISDMLYIDLPVGSFSHCCVYRISTGEMEYLGTSEEGEWWLAF